MSASSKTWINNQAPSVEDEDLNGFNLENNNLITGSGQSLSPADNQQTHKAVASYATVGEFFTGGGIADVYTLAVPSPRVAPPALIDGMNFRAIFGATNTGASTLNPFGLGVEDIKLVGGVTDPAAGDIVSGTEVELTYRTSPGNHFELTNPQVTGTATGVLSTDNLLHVRDEKTSGTAGGTFTAGAYQIRDLNTVVTNTIAGASLAANLIILPIGTYYIEARAPGYLVQSHKTKLRNFTDSTNLIIGETAQSATVNPTMSHSQVTGVFVLPGTKTLQLEHRCSSTRAADGFGEQSTFGDVEVYAEVKIWKVA